MNRNLIAIAALTLLAPALLDQPTAAAQSLDAAPAQVGWVAPKTPAPAAPKTATMRLTLTNQFTSTGERILNLELLLDGKVSDRVQAVSGKSPVQQFRTGRDSRSGSREPLPEGVYSVGAVDRAGGLPRAMGDTFIPLTPQFATARDGIGIHWDADRHVPGGAGTIGCLGVLRRDHLNRVAEFVATYRVRTLTVDYGLGTGNLANRP